jgi:aspartoacylase
MGKVLVVGGTHGNECNAPWLLRTPRPDEGGLNKNGLDTAGLAVLPLLGNPEALAAGRRYLDRDLNRSFEPALVADPSRGEHELGLARRWLDRYGPLGKEPCLVALDLHSTTAAMGNCLVAYGRRQRISLWRRLSSIGWACLFICMRGIPPRAVIWWRAGPVAW